MFLGLRISSWILARTAPRPLLELSRLTEDGFYPRLRFAAYLLGGGNFSFHRRAHDMSELTRRIPLVNTFQLLLRRSRFHRTLSLLESVLRGRVYA